MSDDISFNLFGDGGFINPTPWSHSQDRAPGRWDIPFYDSYTGRFYKKQTQDFDGGWRWFDAYDVEALTIYNVKLDKRAYFHLTHRDMVGTLLNPETLLQWAKAMVLVEHAFYTAREQLLDQIRASVKQARIEIMKEIRGDSAFLHPVH